MNEMRRLMNLVESTKPHLEAVLRTTVEEYNLQADPEQGRLTAKSPGIRVWTRGDGTRYRDPAKVLVYNDEHPNGEQAISDFWQWLSAKPGATPAGQVSGEFGSSSFGDTIKYGGFLWVNRGFSSKCDVDEPRP